MTTQRIAAHMDRDGTVTQQSHRKQAVLWPHAARQDPARHRAHGAPRCPPRCPPPPPHALIY